VFEGFSEVEGVAVEGVAVEGVSDVEGFSDGLPAMYGPACAFSRPQHSGMSCRTLRKQG
jgi:hypothetical protein